MPKRSAAADAILEELGAKGTEQTRRTYVRHGAPRERCLGVLNADLKIIAKTIKGNQDLAYELYDSGFMEAMYLAGIVASGAAMSGKRLEAWADAAAGLPMVVEYTVPWVAVENPLGRELAIRWIGSNKEHLACSGWMTYSGLLQTMSDGDLDLAEIETLLGNVARDIQLVPNRVRHNMNGFVIAAGSYVKPLQAKAMAVAKSIGKVEVDVGDAECKIPLATASIEKVAAAGKIGQKRKTIRC